MLLITMKNGQTTLMLLVMCLASLAPMLATPQSLSSPEIEQETAGRALLDWTITDISVGNATEPAESWTQPDGSGGEEAFNQTDAAAFVWGKKIS